LPLAEIQKILHLGVSSASNDKDKATKFPSFAVASLHL